MKKIICSLFILLFSTLATAGTAKIECDHDENGRYGTEYTIKTFSHAGYDHVGLIDIDEDAVVTMARLKDMSKGVTPIISGGGKALIENATYSLYLPQDMMPPKKCDVLSFTLFGGPEIYPDQWWLYARVLPYFSYFCKWNPNLLNGCKMVVVGDMYDGSFFDKKIDLTATCSKGVLNDGALMSYKPWEPCVGCEPSCFTAGTKISTSSGYKNIEELKVGDEVLSYDVKTSTIKPSKITKVFKHQSKSFGELVLSNGTKLNVTKEHPFYNVDNKKYIKAEKLVAGDKLLFNKGGKTEVVTVIGYKKSTDKADVYNITVEGLHNYFANDVLAHNKL